MASASSARWLGPAGAVVCLAGVWLVVPIDASGYERTVQAPPAATDTDPVRQVVNDYVGLYRKDTLARWRTLFLPTFSAISTNADGTVTVRTLNQFYEAQARGFASATEMSEVLEHVVIERSGRLATAWADFVFSQDDTSRRGRLVLTLVESEGAWRIAGLMFSY